MNKRLFLSFLLICVYYYLGAQGATGPLASMFSELELNRVQTGYLLDIAVERADLHKYNGILGSDNYSDAAVFRNVLPSQVEFDAGDGLGYRSIGYNPT